MYREHVINYSTDKSTIIATEFIITFYTSTHLIIAGIGLGNNYTKMLTLLYFYLAQVMLHKTKINLLC